LWPGRRWRGQDGAAQALRTCESVQMDPLMVVARSHHLVLHSRVMDYQPEHLDQLMYSQRQFFDYGGHLNIYPMPELPYWRLSMRRLAEDGRWQKFIVEHESLLKQVRGELRQRGPLGNRDLDGQRVVGDYRGRKDTSLALYCLWLTGETMTHHRHGFQRLYDFRQNVAPKEFDYAASEEEAEDYFARKIVALSGLVTEGEWKSRFYGFTRRKLDWAEAHDWIERLGRAEVLAPISVEGLRGKFYVLAADLPFLERLESGGRPSAWEPLETTTLDEVTFLAPLDQVSARGRATKLFDFEYLWEVYKPIEQRRWGYYTLPILYSDRLVARLDPKLERTTQTLQIKGFWAEGDAPVGEAAFASALGGGLIRFAGFLGAERLDLAGMPDGRLKQRVKRCIQDESDLKVN
jgi:uncharacterized protein YcaQ